MWRAAAHNPVVWLVSVSSDQELIVLVITNAQARDNCAALRAAESLHESRINTTTSIIEIERK